MRAVKSRPGRVGDLEARSAITSSPAPRTSLRGSTCRVVAAVSWRRPARASGPTALAGRRRLVLVAPALTPTLTRTRAAPARNDASTSSDGDYTYTTDDEEDDAEEEPSFFRRAVDLLLHRAASRRERGLATCIACRGQGTLRCPACAGAGRLSGARVAADGLRTNRCSRCSGLGTIVCPTCLGVGSNRVPVGR